MRAAFAPIWSRTRCPWGHKTLAAYLGTDRGAWASYDACELLRSGGRLPELLVDQGESDQFLEEQLMPHLLEKACEETGVALTLHRQPGYDHSYYFVASFIDDHLEWHARRLTG